MKSNKPKRESREQTSSHFTRRIWRQLVNMTWAIPYWFIRTLHVWQPVFTFGLFALFLFSSRGVMVNHSSRVGQKEHINFHIKASSWSKNREIKIVNSDSMDEESWRRSLRCQAGLTDAWIGVITVGEFEIMAVRLKTCLVNLANNGSIIHTPHHAQGKKSYLGATISRHGRG